MLLRKAFTKKTKQFKVFITNFSAELSKSSLSTKFLTYPPNKYKYLKQKVNFTKNYLYTAIIQII